MGHFFAGLGLEFVACFCKAPFGSKGANLNPVELDFFAELKLLFLGAEHRWNSFLCERNTASMRSKQEKEVLKDHGSVSFAFVEKLFACKSQAACRKKK